MAQSGGFAESQYPHVPSSNVSQQGVDVLHLQLLVHRSNRMRWMDGDRMPAGQGVSPI